MIRENSSKVQQWRWVRWPDLVRRVLDGSFEVSPWSRMQVAELADLDVHAVRADTGLLPDAFIP